MQPRPHHPANSYCHGYDCESQSCICPAAVPFEIKPRTAHAAVMAEVGTASQLHIEFVQIVGLILAGFGTKGTLDELYRRCHATNRCRFHDQDWYLCVSYAGTAKCHHHHNSNHINNQQYIEYYHECDDDYKAAAALDSGMTRIILPWDWAICV